jgi:hypothetical protein
VEVIKKRPTEVEQEPTIFTRKVNGNGNGAAIGRRFGRNGIMHAQSDASTGESPWQYGSIGLVFLFVSAAQTRMVWLLKWPDCCWFAGLLQARSCGSWEPCRFSASRAPIQSVRTH